MKYLINELKYQSLDQVLWFNIQTEAIEEVLTEESPYWSAWEQKVAWDDKITNIDEIAARYTERAGLYKEFSKITAISYGRVVDGEFKVKQIASEDEAQLITDFFTDVELFANGGVKFLGGFGALSFSVPFISFRAMVNNVEVIPSYDIGGIAPWNIKHVIDTQNLLKGTSQTFISLLGACAAFGVKLEEEKDLIQTNYSVVQLFCKYVRGALPVLKIVQKTEVKQLPVLERIYKSKEVTTKDKEDIESILKKKKPTKKDKEIIKEIITRLYVSCEMFKSDSPDIAAKKEQQIQNIIDEITS